MIDFANVQNLLKRKHQKIAPKKVAREMRPHCPECKAAMNRKGRLENEDASGSAIVFQCPACKNVEMIWKEYDNEFRTNYP